DEHAGRAEPELDRGVERLLDRGGRRLRRQPADTDATDRDAGRDRPRRVVRPDRGGRPQQGDDRDKKNDALHALRLPKIRGSLVMIPSAPASISLCAARGSSTVQTYTAAPTSCARRIAAGEATE